MDAPDVPDEAVGLVPFTMIPVWLFDLGPDCVVVYAAVASFVNNASKTGFPSIPAIAARCGRGQTSVRKALRHLEVARAITITPTAKKNGSPTSHRYDVRPALHEVGCRAGWGGGSRGEPGVVRVANHPGSRGEGELELPDLEGEVNLSLDDVLDLAVLDRAGPVARTSAGAREAERLCLQLADAIRENGCRRPTINKDWLDNARLLVDKDGVSPEEVSAAIQWATSHAFWRANIMSMPKLREKFDTLRMQARRERETGPGRAEAVKQGLMEMAGEA